MFKGAANVVNLRKIAELANSSLDLGAGDDTQTAFDQLLSSWSLSFFICKMRRLLAFWQDC